MSPSTLGEKFYTREKNSVFAASRHKGTGEEERMNRRESGVVLHIASLPNPYGIGTLGRSAYEFVDFLHRAGQRYWQVLPLVPTGYGDSPYQSCSGAAGNPYFIDLEMLEEEGLLRSSEYTSVDFGQNPDRVDYSRLYAARLEVLRRAFARGHRKHAEEMAAFSRENRAWLPDFALFMAAKVHFGMMPLSRWPDRALAEREPAALEKYGTLLKEETAFWTFLQWLFYRQWEALRAYARKSEVRLIGDLPFYVSEDSVEVWAQRELFLLDEQGAPTEVAGVPPDLYALTGQLWGNPLYDWKAHAADDFAWWRWRVRHAARFFDVLRIDHFRGFHTYWSVRAGEADARGGHWRRGPGMKLIRALTAAAPELRVIAEDLGDLEEDARAFVRRTGLPGMAVALYAFDSDADSAYLPHNVAYGQVAYTSTHDSPTFVGWLFGEATDRERDFALDYLRLNEKEGFGWGVVKAVWGSPAHIAMAPMQDILGLDNDARMNTPATLGGNWCWRVRREAYNDKVAALLRSITHTYRRAPPERGGEAGAGSGEGESR